MQCVPLLLQLDAVAMIAAVGAARLVVDMVNVVVDHLTVLEAVFDQHAVGGAVVNVVALYGDVDSRNGHPVS